MVAQLYILQKAIDDEIEKQRLEEELSFPCKPGCCECCSKCFFVSETEFVQIVDSMICNWDDARIDQVISKAHTQWEKLESEAPGTARLMKSQANVKDLLESRELVLPFPCIFLDEDGCCSIYEVRPLSCRTHGIGITNLVQNTRPCSKLPPVLSAWDRYVNLTAFGNEMSKFSFSVDSDGLIRCHSFPLVCYFEALFKDHRTTDDIKNSDVYKNLLYAPGLNF